MEKFVWRSADKEVYNHEESDLQKGVYVSQYFHQYPSHSVFVTQCSTIIAQEIHFLKEPWLTGATFMIKTQNLNSYVMLIKMSMLKTQESDEDED